MYAVFLFFIIPYFFNFIFFFSLIMFGSGTISIYYPLNWGFLHHISKSSLNILYITYPSGNFSWNTPYPMFFVISNGPYLFWSSFFESHFDWVFLAFSHTLSSYFNPWKLCLFLSNYFFMTSFAFSIDIFTVSQLLCSSSQKVSSFGNSVFIIRSPFHECCPKLIKYIL